METKTEIKQVSPSDTTKQEPPETWDEIIAKYLTDRNSNYNNYFIDYLKNNYQPPQKIKP